jgi:fatty-acyl-CoA synthase
VTDWNFAESWRRVAALQPDSPAIRQGDRVVTWGEFHRQASGLASYLVRHGLQPEAKVASFLHNCPEYLVGFYATLLARAVPVNTNYRYEIEELEYLFANSDTDVLIFHGTFADKVDAVRQELGTISQFIHVDDGTTPCPPWATPFATAAATEVGELPTLSGDDLIFLYTGGTTGMPKGVMWRQDDLFDRLNVALLGTITDAMTMDEVVSATLALPKQVMVPACPLMHGTGLFTSMTALTGGSQVLLMENRHYDPVELADLIDRHGVTWIVIVGDPFARPLLRVFDASPGKYNLSSLTMITSSGAMWSEENKKGLLAHHPAMLLVDVFSSSEALGMGQSISAGDSSEQTARFRLGANVRVITDDGREIAPGSEEVGKIALGGRNPLGYYKDNAKTDSTFKLIDGQRFSVPGDMATVNADGTIHLLGRGSQCINSGGEKIFPEEVEETLKMHVAVADACVVGIPDERFGQAVVAAVEFHPGVSATESELVGHVKGHLAAYKAPRAVRVVSSLGRAPNGKMDYGRHQREAAEWVATRN